MNWYSLLDSGDGRKLERFGSKIISRPSSLCSWTRRNRERWDHADAWYDPEKKWSFRKGAFEAWDVEIEEAVISLRLQSNGQLGIFPEHALYLNRVKTVLNSLTTAKSGEKITVLNLFAYTGLASAFCGVASPSPILVTHVDLSKKAIEWAKENADKSGVASDRIRWIVDDALGFMARESRKGATYDVVIIDPPSFSRVSKNNTWTLEEKLPEIAELCFSVLNAKRGSLFFTNHSSVNTVDIVRNLALDRYGESSVTINSDNLVLKEEGSSRLLPAGALIEVMIGG